MTKKLTLYGINNCDTVKKALKWLTTNNIAHQFYDFKKQPLTEALLTKFVELNDWSTLLNKRSTTYRNLSDDIKNNLTDEVAFEQVIAQPTLLKRPLLLIESSDESSQQLHLGFKAELYQSICQ
ncbi:Spx/MgsR family RNA polymerase-binding regulatory protein [Colwellia sp. 4_MG-2023]|uniref:Spx/MgsR family RNA polymerase-binding regulatory protein n=1 Tax=unclassified Colwellia TaxID=196834 RepID=UPI0026E22E0C|nr:MULTISPECIES: Spx/MgsR family RNA polymerase-binding regulatory protein [unclassified Colwellia]MDO6488413.1 Spx/MgsR family RNA polymerase-binding regulatory protein [Colwellia sp. 6_MG-2023]MDO6507044.1 Spx/MgsR family RNA polymerase-binding regulatory protein [Colwellia sp. 5_MG-2023]MDO6555910.1 Spx/MgsR family RNA polymerase-binding regulatory protein [Colwellia sp. 4_MG-2023]